MSPHSYLQKVQDFRLDVKARVCYAYRGSSDEMKDLSRSYVRLVSLGDHRSLNRLHSRRVRSTRTQNSRESERAPKRVRRRNLRRGQWPHNYANHTRRVARKQEPSHMSSLLADHRKY